jgi:hypothetical protein
MSDNYLGFVVNNCHGGGYRDGFFTAYRQVPITWPYKTYITGWIEEGGNLGAGAFPDGQFKSEEAVKAAIDKYHNGEKWNTMLAECNRLKTLLMRWMGKMKHREFGPACERMANRYAVSLIANGGDPAVAAADAETWVLKSIKSIRNSPYTEQFREATDEEIADVVTRQIEFDLENNE